MKKVTVEEFAKDAKALLAMTEQDRVIVMKDGLPIAQLVAIRNKDEEDLALEEDPAFWQMIRERRREKTTYTLAEVKKRFGLDGKKSAKRKTGARTASAKKASAKR